MTYNIGFVKEVPISLDFHVGRLGKRKITYQVVSQDEGREWDSLCLTEHGV